MKRKFILLMTLMCIMGGLNLSHLFAQETVTIGWEGTANTSYIPDYAGMWNKYAYSQQIYLASEINAVGEITHIAFKQASGSMTRTLKVYITHTDKSSFTGASDWVLIDVDPAFSGDVVMTSTDWVSLPLSAPFIYDGTSNLLISVFDETGTTLGNSSYAKYYTYATDEKRSIYVGSQSYCPNPSTGKYTNGSTMQGGPNLSSPVNNQIRFTFAAVDDDLEPATPTGLVATVNDEESISLTWSAAENAQKYNIYQNGVKIGNSNSTSYDVTGLTPNTTYNFTVTGVRGTKESAQSAPVEATTENVGAPSNLVAETIDHKSISLTWTGGDNATSYNIYKNGSYLANTTATSYTVEGLDSETTYTFIVKSVCAGNEYGSSNEDSATTAVAPKTRNIVFTLKDSYGDTWNGGYLTVTATDGTNTTLQMLNGSYSDRVYEETYTLEIAQGATVTVKYTAGDYHSENSYCIAYSGEENFVCSEGSGLVNGNDEYSFTVESFEVSVTLDPAGPIALGDVRMGNYWSENGNKSAQIDVVVKNTEITAVLSSDAFFTASYDAENRVLNVSYDNTANVTGDKSATITIQAENVDDITIPVSATAYTPLAPDIKELATPMSLNSSVTPDFANLHDDYSLSGETNDGENLDAVYTFELTKQSVLITDVTKVDEGEELARSYYAIYRAADVDGNDEGPTSNNHYAGLQSTFGPYDFASADDLNYFNYTPDEWTHSTAYKLNGYAGGDWIFTKASYALNQSSKLSFNCTIYNSAILVVGVKDVSTGTISEVAQYTNSSEAIVELNKEGEYYIGFKVLGSGEYVQAYIDDLQLTDESNSLVPNTYPAGNYYLVAAADKAFKVSLNVQLDVPQNVRATSSNHFAGGDIVLEWDETQDAISYNVYVGDIQTPHNGNNPITETTYTISNIDPADWEIAVTAVYAEGESQKSAPVNVKVSGFGKLEINVKDGETNYGIEDASVVLNGTDEFGNEVEYTPESTTNEAGVLLVENVKAGTYTVTASKFNYYDNVSDPVTVEIGDTESCQVQMKSYPMTPFSVEAVDEYYTAKVSWKTDDYKTFNVYRRNNDGNIEKLTETPITEKLFNDEDWAGFDIGEEYAYGVSTYVPGEPVNLINEGFENGKPETWTVEGGWQKYTNYGYGTSYVNGGVCSYYVYSGTTSGSIYTLTTSEINLGDYNSASLSFYYRNHPFQNRMPGETYYNNTFTVKVKVVGEDNWDVTTMEQDILSYKLAELDLSKYVGKTIQIAFECNTRQYAYTYIDDVVVSAVPMVESKVNWSPAITKEAWSVFNGLSGTEWNNSLNWEGYYPQISTVNVVIDAAAELNVDLATVKNMMINSEASLTLPEGVRLMVGGRLINTVSANLLIEDGAQLYHTSEGVKAKFNMNLNRPEVWSENNKDGWNFVASPFTDVNIPQFTGFGFDEYDYDLYKYDGSQEAEWLNHKDAVNNGAFESANFDLGTGYLLSHEQKETVSFAGTLSNAQYYSWDNMEYTTGSIKDLANFYLLGNPFSFDMDWSYVEKEGVYNGYAVLNETGSGYEYLTSGAIKVGDAFFVKTTGANPSLSYGEASKGQRTEKAESINLIATGAEGSDNVIISLSGAGEEGFNKLQNFNEGIANIYVAKNDTRYGIANFDREVTMVDVAFEAKEMGNYTIAAQPEGKFETLTLVDRFTGIETNLLMEDYSFTATSRDDYNRFVVKLKVNGQQTTDNGQFAYQSGEDLIFNIEGKVQIIDMMGRVVCTSEVESANNRINVSGFNNAAYIIRVINEEGVKVQKLIVNSL